LALFLLNLTFALLRLYPDVAYPRQGKTRQSAPDVGARRLGQDGNSLVVVGAAHLVEDDSMLELLKRKGFEVEQR